MSSIFLSQITQLFGEEFIGNLSVWEALYQDDENNRPLAVIGDSVLDLVISKVGYLDEKDTVHMDRVRKEYTDKKSNQKTLNKDIEFTRYLVEKKHTKSPVGGIGLDKADRFYEAIIGAVFMEHGYEKVEEFVISLLETCPDFVAEFPHPFD